MEIKTTLRFHVTPVRMAFIKKIKNVGKDEQNMFFFYSYVHTMFGSFLPPPFTLSLGVNTNQCS
jgi:hypothetical protein